MPRTRIIAAGLLCLALASSALQALPSDLRQHGVPRPDTGDLVALVWKWVGSIFVPQPEPTDIERVEHQAKQGSQLDPDGNH
jgi:hypothetical protein